MLTPRQRDLLRFLENYTAARDGVSPTFDEMRDALGLQSKSGIFRMLASLEERGFIQRRPNSQRAIRVLRIERGANEVSVADLRGLVARLVSEQGAEIAVAALSEIVRDIGALREIA